MWSFSVFQLLFPALCLLWHVLGLPMLYEFLSMSWTSTACDLCETNPCSDRWLKLWNVGICSLTHWVTQSVPTELVYYLCSTLQQKQKLGVWNGCAKNVHWRVDEHRSPLALGPRLYGPNSSVAAALSSESPTKACSFLCSSSSIGWNTVSVFSSESI